jgi:hypothetical protein
LPRLQVSHPEDTVFWVLAKMEAAKFVWNVSKCLWDYYQHHFPDDSKFPSAVLMVQYLHKISHFTFIIQ